MDRLFETYVYTSVLEWSAKQWHTFTLLTKHEWTSKRENITLQFVFSVSYLSLIICILAVRPNTYPVLPKPTTTQNIFRQQNKYMFTFCLLVMVRKIAVSCQTQRPRMNYIRWHQYPVKPLTGRTLCTSQPVIKLWSSVLQILMQMTHTYDIT